MSTEIAYFKRRMADGYVYFKVYGGPGHTANGYQEVINLQYENEAIISVEHNANGNGLTGTWCTFEVGEPITQSEYDAAYERATHGNFRIA